MPAKDESELDLIWTYHIFPEHGPYPALGMHEIMQTCGFMNCTKPHSDWQHLYLSITVCQYWPALQTQKTHAGFLDLFNQRTSSRNSIGLKWKTNSTQWLRIQSFL